jgi:CRISPR/Cas system CMR-associated protein Cmr5 small subunit
VTSKFRNTKEMIKSGVKLGPDEDYMDVKQLKRFRFGDYFKNDINEETPTDGNDGTNVTKMQSDVKKLTGLIKNKFSAYLSKLDKPIEQAQFLSTMASEIGVPLNKLSSLINTFKDIAKDGVVDNTNIAGMTAERKLITKQELEESIKVKKVIKTIKIKDL